MQVNGNTNLHQAFPDLACILVCPNCPAGLREAFSGSCCETSERRYQGLNIVANGRWRSPLLPSC